jgi:hypothetical protein
VKKLVILLALAACHPAPLPPLDPNGLPPRDDEHVPPPNTVIPATDVDARACLRLAELGCPEAQNGCLAAFSAARTDHVVTPSQCIADALSVDEVRKCGDVSTLTFECKGK